MDDVAILVSKFEGQLVGGVVIVHEDGVNKEAARCTDGIWVVSEDFKLRLAAPEKTEVGTKKKLPSKD